MIILSVGVETDIKCDIEQYATKKWYSAEHSIQLSTASESGYLHSV